MERQIDKWIDRQIDKQLDIYIKYTHTIKRIVRKEEYVRSYQKGKTYKKVSIQLKHNKSTLYIDQRMMRYLHY